jgi:hypothetical protein
MASFEESKQYLINNQFTIELIEKPFIIFKCIQGHITKKPSKKVLPSEKCRFCKETKLDKAKFLLKQRGFIFIASEVLPNRFHKIYWKCNNGHLNDTTAEIFSNQSYCSVCPTPLQEKRLLTAQQILGSRKDIFIEFSRIEDSIKWQCGTCKNETKSPARNIAAGSRCMPCFLKAKKGTICRPRHKIELGTITGNLQVLEDLGVRGGHSFVKVKNNVNGLIGETTTSSFLNGRYKLRSNEELKSIYGANAAKATAVTKGSIRPQYAIYTWQDILDKSKEIGFEFLNCPSNLQQKVFRSSSGGGWVFKCFCRSTFSPSLNNIMNDITRSCGCVKSHGQVELNEYIKSLGLETDWNNKKEIAPFELDIYIPSKKLAIEYQGLHWHGEIIKKDKARIHMQDKATLCKAKGIRLIIMFEDEWLTKQDQVKGYLRAILGLKSKTIGASKCKIIRKNAKVLCAEHHLQGSSNGLEYSLIYKNEVVAAAIFAKPNASRQNFKSNTYELARYCVKPGISVPGGLSRLMKAFCNDNPHILELISYSDNRWSEGSIYRSTGFAKENDGRPSYHYFEYSSQTKRHHRYKFRKSECIKLLPYSSHMTEWQIMQELGYDRIWDLGSAKWVKKLK